MYLAYFHLSEFPFSISPDPRFLFLSRRHREALAHLLYGVGEGGGFVQLTGEVGTGKTTLCRSVLEQAPGEVDVALILNPKQTAPELVASVCDELQVPYPEGTTSLKVLIDALNRHLLASHGSGRRTVLIIDEAQNLGGEALEQIRLLTNLETTTHKLLQIILLGQPELQGLMARPELRQLAQRVTARYHLTPLRRPETAAYVRHRLAVAGGDPSTFTGGALRLVHRLSGGVPRLVNVICDRALLGAYARNAPRVTRALVRRAAREVRGERIARTRRAGWAWAAACLAVVAVAAAWWSMRWGEWGAGLRVDPPVSSGVVAASPAPPVEPVSAPEEARTEGPGVGDGQEAVSSSVQPVVETGPEDVAPETAPPETVPLEPPLLEVLASSDGTDAETAFATLFAYWGEDYFQLEGRTACDRAVEAGLECLFRQGNWTALRLFNRPSILELASPGSGTWEVAVVALNDGEVTLDLGGTRRTFPQTDVDALWYGSFVALWRPPDLGADTLRLGSVGPGVVWLRGQLARYGDGEAPTGGGTGSPLFDEELERKVMEFQRSRALKADGIVGRQTLLQLQAEDPTTPVLWRNPG